MGRGRGDEHHQRAEAPDVWAVRHPAPDPPEALASSRCQHQDAVQIGEDEDTRGWNVSSGLDRLAQQRMDAATLPRLLDQPRTRVLVWLDGKFPVLGGATGRTLATRRPVESDAAGRAVLLGRDRKGATWLARLLGPVGEDLVVPIDLSDGAAPNAAGHARSAGYGDDESGQPSPEEIIAMASTGLPGVSWQGLGEAGPDLSRTELQIAMTVQALARWHASNPRCSRCGTTTRAAHSGWMRRCPQDDSEHYPRSDPAVIMAVTDPQDRLLLARSPHWPPARMSVLAGFVEPGETLEAAVVREVREEVGLDVVDIRYAGSQPWPFPASIMLGYTARADLSALRL